MATALAAHGRLSQALRSGSERQGALLGALRQSFGREERRLQALEQMLKQLEAGKEGQRPAKELHEILVEFHATLQHSQEELEAPCLSEGLGGLQGMVFAQGRLGERLFSAPAGRNHGGSRPRAAATCAGGHSDATEAGEAMCVGCRGPG